MNVPAPIGWPGTEAQWRARVSDLRFEWFALVSDLRGHGVDVPKGDRQAEDDYVTRRVLELCRWNGWTVAA